MNHVTHDLGGLGYPSQRPQSLGWPRNQGLASVRVVVTVINDLHTIDAVVEADMDDRGSYVDWLLNDDISVITKWTPSESISGAANDGNLLSRSSLVKSTTKYPLSVMFISNLRINKACDIQQPPVILCLPISLAWWYWWIDNLLIGELWHFVEFLV